MEDDCPYPCSSHTTTTLRLFLFFYSLLMVIEKILPLTNGGAQVAPLDVS